MIWHIRNWDLKWDISNGLEERNLVSSKVYSEVSSCNMKLMAGAKLIAIEKDFWEFYEFILVIKVVHIPFSYHHGVRLVKMSEKPVNANFCVSRSNIWLIQNIGKLLYMSQKSWFSDTL